MNGMLWWLVQNALVATVLAGLVTLVCRFARPSPAVRHALWVIVLIKLIAPPIIYWPWSAESLWQPIGHWFMANQSREAKEQSEPRTTAVPGTLTPEIQDSDTPAEVILVPLTSEEEPNAAIVQPPQANEIIEECSSETPEITSKSQTRIWSDSVEQSIIQAWLVGAVAMLMWQTTKIG